MGLLFQGYVFLRPSLDKWEDVVHDLHVLFRNFHGKAGWGHHQPIGSMYSTEIRGNSWVPLGE